MGGRNHQNWNDSYKCCRIQTALRTTYIFLLTLESCTATKRLSGDGASHKMENWSLQVLFTDHKQ